MDHQNFTYTRTPNSKKGKFNIDKGEYSKMRKSLKNRLKQTSGVDRGGNKINYAEDKSKKPNNN